MVGSPRRRQRRDELRRPVGDGQALHGKHRRDDQRSALRAGGRAAVPRDGRGAAVPPELRDRAQAGADAEVGRGPRDPADGGRRRDLFRRRAADELRNRQPPRPGQVRSVEVQELCRRRRAASGGARHPHQGSLPRRLPAAGLWPDRDQRSRLRQLQRELPRQARFDRPPVEADGRPGNPRRCRKPAAARAGGRGLHPLGRQFPWLLEERGRHQGCLHRQRLFPHRRPRLS